MGELTTTGRKAAYWDKPKPGASGAFRNAAYWERPAVEILPPPARPEPPPVIQSHDPDAPYYDIRRDPQYQTEEFRASLRAQGIQGPPVSFR